MDFEKVAESLSSVAESVADRTKALKRQQDLIKEALEAVHRDPPNVARLHRVLTSPDRAALAAEFPESDEPLAELERWAEPEWDELFLDYAGRFRALVAESGLYIQGQAPRFIVGRGIHVEFDTAKNQTVVDGHKLPSIDLSEAMAYVRERHDRLWVPDFDTQSFVVDLYAAYRVLLEEGQGPGGTVRILRLYEQFKNSLPEPRKRAFDRDRFASGVSRVLEGGVLTPDGHALFLSSGANSREALWIWLPHEKAMGYRGLVTFKEHHG